MNLLTWRNSKIIKSCLILVNIAGAHLYKFSDYFMQCLEGQICVYRQTDGQGSFKADLSTIKEAANTILKFWYLTIVFDQYFDVKKRYWTLHFSEPIKALTVVRKLVFSYRFLILTSNSKVQYVYVHISYWAAFYNLYT